MVVAASHSAHCWWLAEAYLEDPRKVPLRRWWQRPTVRTTVVAASHGSYSDPRASVKHCYYLIYLCARVWFSVSALFGSAGCAGFSAPSRLSRVPRITIYFFLSSSAVPWACFKMSESPASMIVITDTRKNLPTAVPMSMLLPLYGTTITFASMQ